MKDFSVLVALQLQVNFILHTAAFQFFENSLCQKERIFCIIA